MSVIEVDRQGLARKLAHKPKAYIIYELLQNALDENPTTIKVVYEMIPGKPLCHIRVEDDDPDGFQDLESIYTLFRDSKKGPDPKKRGRFELGEKLIIATATSMVVQTTKGTISFEGETRTESRHRTKVGTVVDLHVRMTRDEFERMKQDLLLFLTEPRIKVLFNETPAEPRKKIATIETTLPTVYTDEEGQLKPTSRRTVVDVYETRDGEEAHLYEMGIPVMTTGYKWHLDVRQRVPINWERDSVPAHFRNLLKTAVLNELHALLSKEDSKSEWVQSILEEADEAALNTVLTHQFGEKRVAYDPSDPEANSLAVSKGYTVVPGGAFRGSVWARARTYGIILPAGRVTPSPKPYSDDPDASPEKLLPEDKWSNDIRRIVRLTERLGDRLLDGEHVSVRISLSTNGFAANFGAGMFGSDFCFNLRRLGYAWFALPNTDERVLNLIIHEFAHYYESNHLSEKYHEALSRLAAKGIQLALKEPEVFQDPGV